MASYEQNSQSRLWSVRFRETRAGVEHQKRLSGFKTKREAQQAYAEYVANHIDDSAQPQQISFVALYNEFIENAKTRMKESSYLDLVRKFETRILPYFQSYNIVDLTPRIISQWQNQLAEQGYAYKYRKDLRNYLSRLLKFGESHYDLPNVMPKVEKFRNTERKKEMLFWTPDEFRKFIAVVQKSELKAYFMTLYYTGMRKGEAQALTWKDIDFENSTITVNKSITRKTTEGSWKITSPKNESSNRKITINQQLKEILLAHKQDTLETDFVFGRTAPLSNTTIDRYLRIYATEAGVKIIRQHDFRHSHASLLIANGISIVAVSKRLGHSTVSQTLDTYSHLMPSEEQRTIELLDRIASIS